LTPIYERGGIGGKSRWESKMKKLALVLLCIGCAAESPEYKPPSLVSPLGGSFDRTILFQFSPNTPDSDRVKDYSYSIEISTKADFSSMAASASMKVWTKYDMPASLLRTGQHFWRVCGTYYEYTKQSTQTCSDAVEFYYDGNDGAIYVDPAKIGGRELGTKTDPVKTIAAAFDALTYRGLSSIRLANAAYTGAVSQVSGVSIKGCYNATTWARNTGACATTFSDAAAYTFYAVDQ
jgi:hypothetical protein